MGNDTLRLKEIGPIREAEVRFGDLTVLVGPQATGKSILLQFLRLLLDRGPIVHTLRKYGLKWDGKASSFLELYFGEGMGALWDSNRSAISWRGSAVDLRRFVRYGSTTEVETSFYIPAQRVLALSRDGWVRPFADYKPGDPFTVRDFSEKLRVLMESPLGRAQALFPQPKRLKAQIRTLLSRHIFRGFRLEVEKAGLQQRLLLTEPKLQGGAKLPFLVWSAGQREFAPLLLGLYWLLPPTKVARREAIQWAIVEEIEAGLHPKGIQAVLFMVLDLLWRGYRVCLSTHSVHVLDMVWALRNLRECQADPRYVLRMLGARADPPTREVAQAALQKDIAVYYFDQSGNARNISKLDPAAKETMEAEWGGLTEFSGRLADIVAEAVAARGERE